MGQANDTGLGKLLETYGFKIGQDFVFDQPKRPRPGRPAGGRQMLRQRPLLRRRRRPAEEQGPLRARRHRARWCSPSPARVELVGPLAGGKPQAGKLWTLACPRRRRGSTPGSSSRRGEDRGGQGQGLVRPRLRLPGPAQERLRPAAATPPGMSDARRPARRRRVEEAGAPGGDRRLRLRQRRVPAARPLPPLLQGGRADAVQRHQLDGRGRGADAAAHQDADRASAPDRIAWLRAGASGRATSSACRLAFCLFGVVRWRVRRARRQGQKL